MACPPVVGAAAVLASQRSTANPNQIRTTIERIAKTVTGTEKAYYGAGFLDPFAALQ